MVKVFVRVMESTPSAVTVTLIITLVSSSTEAELKATMRLSAGLNVPALSGSQLQAYETPLPQVQTIL
jgi:hypothetical protein